MFLKHDKAFLWCWMIENLMRRDKNKKENYDFVTLLYALQDGLEPTTP